MRPNDRQEKPLKGDKLVKLEHDSRGVVLPVRAQAAARRNAVLGARDGILRVAVTAAPEKGMANKAIAELLSKTLGVPKSAVVLLSGETSPRKKFLLIGGKADAIRSAIAEIIDDQ